METYPATIEPEFWEEPYTSPKEFIGVSKPIDLYCLWANIKPRIKDE